MASSDTESSKGSNTMAKANNYLAVNLHKQLAKSEKQTTVFFSPLSLSTVLAMIYCGAKDETAKELQSVLGYDEANIQKECVPSYFLQILTTLESSAKASVLNCANSLVIRKDFAIKQAYKSLLENSFKAVLMEGDFLNESQKVVNQINKWVKEKTNGMISDLLNSLDASTAMVLLNVVYFKGNWLHQFDPDATFLDDFYNKGSDESPKQVKMMHQNNRLPFVNKNGFKALQLPYEGEKTAMLILLPHSRNGFPELESALDTTMLQEVWQEMVVQRVDVVLPRFRLEYSKSLKNAFEILGLKRVFRTGLDLGGISDSKELYLSEILHKAALEVNEDGCEAAATTGLVFSDCCMSSNPQFVVDHPFLFVIYDVRSNLILFMGRVDEL